MSSSATSPPPGIGGWLKLVGAALVLLLGFASLKTCTALVEAVSQEPGKKPPAQQPPTREGPARKEPAKHGARPR